MERKRPCHSTINIPFFLSMAAKRVAGKINFSTLPLLFLEIDQPVALSVVFGFSIFISVILRFLACPLDFYFDMYLYFY